MKVSPFVGRVSFLRHLKTVEALIKNTCSKRADNLLRQALRADLPADLTFSVEAQATKSKASSVHLHYDSHVNSM